MGLELAEVREGRILRHRLQEVQHRAPLRVRGVEEGLEVCLPGGREAGQDGRADAPGQDIGGHLAATSLADRLDERRNSR